MKTIAFTLVSILSLAALAAPTVSNVSMTQSNSQTVRVDYTLDEAAVVTLDILTNATADAWASLGADNIKTLWGDVGVLIQPGTHTIFWAPEKSWIETHPHTYDVRAAVKAWAVTAPPDYMVVDLRPSNELGGAPRIRYFETAEQVPDGVTDRKYKTDYLLMRKIPAKGMTYRMGSPSGEVGKSKSENSDWDGVETLRHVTLTNDFYLGVYELTRKQGITYTGYGNPGSVSGYEAYPVGGDNGKGWISYGDMRGTTYLWPQDGRQVGGGALYELRHRTGIDFDLPTEAQWEFACRAGTSSALYTGEELTGETTSANLDAIAWYKGNANNQHEVGLLLPNAFGLYDMLGNVGEFCVDRITHNALTSGAVTEPVGIDSGDNHAIRGGSYAKAANHARAAHRQDYVSASDHFGECGFRLWAPAIAK